MAIVISNASTVRFTNAFFSGTTIFFSVEYDNNSSVNTHTYRLRNPSGTVVSSGNIFPSSTSTISYAETFSPNFTGTFIADKFGPNGGNLGTAFLSFTAPTPPPFFPPFFPYFPFFPFFPFFPTFTPIPDFSDQTVQNAKLNIPYSDGVFADNTTSYSVSSGALPSGIVLNTSTGAITGTSTQIQESSFVIQASGPGGSKLTGTLSINVLPAGVRVTGPSSKTNLSNVKRFTGATWENLQVMKKYDGVSWQNIANE